MPPVVQEDPNARRLSISTSRGSQKKKKLKKRNKLPSLGRGAKEGGITNIQRYKINTLEKEIILPIAEVVPNIMRAVVKTSLPRTCS
jgi:hypothetical protein